MRIEKHYERFDLDTNLVITEKIVTNTFNR